MLPLDVPTREEFDRLASVRGDACVSIYLETTPLSQASDAARIELGNRLGEAVRQLEAVELGRGRLGALRELVLDLQDDDEFWRMQANSLAVFATPDRVITFRLANTLPNQVHVADRFHLKPLLRAITFPHVALVLALSENGARLIEVPPEGPPVPVPVEGMPKDAASSVGKSSINDRSHSQRIHGSEGKKIRLAQYARAVDGAVRPVLAGLEVPLMLAAPEPLASIFRGLSSSTRLVAQTIEGSPDRTPDAELAAAARTLLDGLYAEEVAAVRSLFATRANQGRSTADLATAARAASRGAIDTLLVDIDAVVPGTFDEETGAITRAGEASASSYGVIDAVAARALATGARVLGVRAGDLPAPGELAAILRYAV